MTTGRKISTKKDCDAIFLGFGVDNAWLDALDRKLLTHLRDTFGGRATWLSTIASVIGEEVATIEDVVEPYLLQIGLIERTPRGRQITKKGEEYIA
jgi:Holliday junction DNA helicase RuvB